MTPVPLDEQVAVRPTLLSPARICLPQTREVMGTHATSLPRFEGLRVVPASSTATPSLLIVIDGTYPVPRRQPDRACRAPCTVQVGPLMPGGIVCRSLRKEGRRAPACTVQPEGPPCP
jgi:hypothetical protein